jgi:2-polyprenyl-6-methoxyphenol hydroxylase-like FAD-dependent oxidoreductase
MIETPQRIAVVGLGVAGATVAILLARQGHNVTVFEQCEAPGPAGAGVLLQPSGQLVLERLGLLDAAIGRSVPVRYLHARTHTGRTLTHLRYADFQPNLTAYGIHRGDLFTILYEELCKTTATIRLNVKAASYRIRPTHVTLIDDAGNGIKDFDFILGCDGARSTLRTHSNIPYLAHSYPHGAIWATGTCAAINDHLLQVTRGTKHLCGLLPTADGQCSLFWSLRTDERDAFHARAFAAWKNEVIALCPQAEEIFTTLTSFDQTRFTNYMHVRMPIPCDARCLFLGDAAHAMSPHLGQGINLALIDAYIFAHSAHVSDDFAAACRLYTRLRTPHLRVYSAITWLLSPFFQSRGIVKAGLRNIFLPLMPKIPPLKKQMLVTMSGLRKNFLGGRLQLPPAPPSDPKP